MNIMVVSDDHGITGFEEAYRLLRKKVGTIDALLHAGDVEHFNEDYYARICECPVYIVRGNNDFNDAPLERMVNLGGKKIFITHGHRYGVYTDKQRLYLAGKERGADIIVFGHTHVAEHIKMDDMDILNPGSITLPRRGRYGSCALINIEDDQVAITHFSLV